MSKDGEWVLKRKICHHCQRGELPLQKTKFTLDGERYNEPLCADCAASLAPSLTGMMPMECWRCKWEGLLKETEPCPVCNKTDQLHEDTEAL